MRVVSCALQSALVAVVGLSLTGSALAETRQPEGETVAALPEGQVQTLQALVISIEGTAQWRPNEDEAFRPLAENDILDAGAEIRTALRSMVTLRVGHNATIDIHSVSRVRLPEMLQDGETLRTRTVVHSGQADVKVDAVGLTNDFQVLTPSTTLAVRGTYFSVRYGGLFGTQINMFDPDHISAAEIKYFTRKQRAVRVANGQTSKESLPSPVMNALFKTISPPPVTEAVVEPDQAQPQVYQAQSTEKKVGEERMVDYDKNIAARTQGALGIAYEDASRRPPGLGAGDDRFPPGIFGGSGNPNDGRDGGNRPATPNRADRSGGGSRVISQRP